MARSFGTIVTTPYGLGLYSLPISLGVKKLVQPSMMAANIVWANYGAGGNKPNVGVNVNMGNQGVVNKLDRILSVYIDNTQSNSPVYVQFPDTDFTVSCGPNSEIFQAVITNLLEANIYGEGFTAGVQPTTAVYFLNTLVNPSSNSELPVNYPQYLASPTVISPNPLFNGAYGNPALGDLVAFTGLNIGSQGALQILAPQPSGFYIITSMDVSIGALSTAVGLQSFELSFKEHTITNTPWAWQIGADTNFVPLLKVYSNSGMNVKLDATVEWDFTYFGSNVNGLANMTITYTYTQVK
jgi:hypothetical protein